MAIREVCFCGWHGDVESREPFYMNPGQWALACPNCGRLDRLEWLSDAMRKSVIAEARRRFVARLSKAA